ncbi:hypothetical protein FWC63_03245 [Candidatus Saccharibacteria bacterium]|nr:hypothetical protein [Candidatus Saccharibacteria bacterium]
MDRIHHEAIRSDGVRFEGSFTINAHRHDIVVGDFLQFEEGGIPFGPPRGLERSTSGAYAAAFKNAIIVNPESFPDLDEFIADIDREAGVIFWRATALEGGVTKSPWGEDTNNSGTPDYTFNPNPGTPPWHTEHPAYIHGTGQTVMPLSMPAPPLSESDVVCLAPAGRSPGSDN